ncbi:MAG: glycosyltransferase, partial [Chitinophagaceae bacterium]
QELAMIYQSAAIFCYLSVFEGFGIPIIESLYSRTPVIASKGGCFTEAGGPDSIYIDYWDDKALGEKINLLLNDESMNKNIIEKGFNYVQKFNNGNIASEMMELYYKLIHS